MGNYKQNFYLNTKHRMKNTAVIAATCTIAQAINIRSRAHAKNEDLVDTAIDVGTWAWENQDAIIDTVSDIFSGWAQNKAKIRGEDWVDTALM